MRISFFRANTMGEVLELMSSCDVSSKKDSSKGAGSWKAVIVFKDAQDFTLKFEKLKVLCLEAQEVLQVQEGIFLSSKCFSKESLAFVFPGQGSQYPGMLSSFKDYPIFNNEWDLLVAKAEDSGVQLSPLLASTGEQSLLDQTKFSQPALAVASWSMAKLLQSYGVTPAVVAGHSFGELVALAAAECYDHETLMDLSIERGRLMTQAGELSPGKMIAVVDRSSDDWRKIHERLTSLALVGETVELANINTHSQIVYSGSEKDILQLREGSAKENIKSALLSSSAAFHSRLMAPAAMEFQSFLHSKVARFSRPKTLVISNLEGHEYSTPSDITHNLEAQLQGQVNWVHVIEKMVSSGSQIFLEVGPRSILTKMLKELLPSDAFVIAIDAGQPFEHTLGFLLCLGIEVTFPAETTAPFDWNMQTKNKIIEGFLAKQRELLKQSLSIKDPATRKVIERTILSDTEEVLNVYFSAVGPPPLEEKIVSSTQESPDEVTRAILEELASITGFKTQEIKLDASFDNDLYLDSITRLELLSNLSSRFSADISDMSALLNANSIKDLAAIIGKSVVATTSVLSAEIVWLRKEISNYTGISEEKIGLETRFTEDLMLDSLIRMDILGSLQSRFPELEIDFASFHQVNNLADLKKFFVGKTSEESTKLASEHKFSKSLRESLASYLGLSIDKVLTTCNFEHDVSMNIFEKEDFITSLLIKHPYLQQAGRELLHAQTIGDMLELEKLFDRRSTGRTINEEVVRYTFKQQEIERVSFGECTFPDDLLVFSLGERSDYTEVMTHIKSMKKNIRLKNLKSLQLKTVQNILSTFKSTDRLDVLFLISKLDSDLESNIKFTYDLSTVLKEIAENVPQLSVKVLINGSQNLYLKGLVGLCRSFSKEYQATFNIVDLPWARKSPKNLPWILLWDLKDRNKERCSFYTMTGKKYYTELLEKKSSSLEAQTLNLPESPHILLVGGARGITAEVAKFLADQFNARISALGRTPAGDSMPFEECQSDNELREKIKELLEEQNPNMPQEDLNRLFNQRLKTVNNQREIWKTKHSIESRGAEFRYYQVDAVNPLELKEVVKQIEKNSGPIQGIIHAAGITRDGLFKNKNLEEFEEVVNTKVQSAINIHTLFKHRKDLSFACFFSSLSSWSGAPGQTDYSLANEILNAIAEDWNRIASFPVSALLWSVWNETGLASETLIKQMELLKLGGISNRAGIRLFREELINFGLNSPKVLFAPESTLQFGLDYQNE